MMSLPGISLSVLSCEEEGIKRSDDDTHSQKSHIDPVTNKIASAIAVSIDIRCDKLMELYSRSVSVKTQKD